MPLILNDKTYYIFFLKNLRRFLRGSFYDTILSYKLTCDAAQNTYHRPYRVLLSENGEDYYYKLFNLYFFFFLFGRLVRYTVDAKRRRYAEWAAVTAEVNESDRRFSMLQETDSPVQHTSARP